MHETCEISRNDAAAVKKKSVAHSGFPIEEKEWNEFEPFLE